MRHAVIVVASNILTHQFVAFGSACAYGVSIICGSG